MPDKLEVLALTILAVALIGLGLVILAFEKNISWGNQVVTLGVLFMIYAELRGRR